MAEVEQPRDNATDAASAVPAAPLKVERVLSSVFEKKDSCDVTNDFLEACSFISRGELVKTDTFNFKDAMNAIELMEPKMDLGMVPIDHTLGLEYAIKHKLIDHKSMAVDQQIAIFDASMASIATLIGGAMPDQTVYTNILLQDPDRLESPTLKALANSIRAFSRFIRYTIELGAVVHEEDYCPTCYADTALATSDNSETIDELTELLKDLKAADSKDPLDKALYNRLNFMRHFLILMRALIPSPSVMAVDSEEVFSVDFGTAAHSIAVMEKTFAEIKTSVHLGAQPPEGKTDELYEWLPVFQQNVNRHLSPGTFPKAAAIMSRVKSFEFWDEHLHYLMHIVADFPKRSATVEDFIGYVRDASEKNADVLIRAVMQIVIVPFNDCLFGVTPFTELVVKSVQNTTYPTILNKDFPLCKEPELNKVWEACANHCTRLLISVLQLHGLNLARQRERIVQILEDAAIVYTDAERADQVFSDYIKPRFPEMVSLKPFPISTYVAQVIMGLMRYYIVLGFNCKLYAVHELPYTYWYLGEVIGLWRYRLWTQAKDYLQVDRKITLPGSESKRCERRAKQREIQLQPRLIEIELAFLRDRVEASFCESYVSLLSGFISAGLLVIPENEQNRYSCRFKPFAVAPDFARIPYKLYLEESQFYRFAELPAVICYKRAIGTFQAAIENLSYIQHHNPSDLWAQKLQRLAKQNLIASKLLSVDSTRKATFEFTDETFLFPLVKIT